MITNLYSLIKKTSQQKGRKLKIICNINDVIRPMKSSAVYLKKIFLLKNITTFFERKEVMKMKEEFKELMMQTNK